MGKANSVSGYHSNERTTFETANRRSCVRWLTITRRILWPQSVHVDRMLLCNQRNGSRNQNTDLTSPLWEKANTTLVGKKICALHDVPNEVALSLPLSVTLGIRLPVTEL